MSEWKTFKLGDFAEINPKISLKQGQEYSFIEMKDLDVTFKYVSPSTKKELKGGSKFQNGDTLFARITPCLENGKICQVKNLENNLGFGSTEFLVFRGRKNVSDSDFVYYLSRSEFVMNNAIQLMTGSSGRQRVEKSTLAELEIIVPEDIYTQTQIAQILTSLDDKIELNLQMNQTLEAMAQAIFKEWFVDFNYPNATGEMIDSEMGEIPKGWRVGIFDEIIEFINGYAFKSDELEKVEDIDSYAIFKMGHIKKGGGFNPTKTKDYISKNQCTKLEKYILKSGDILMCMTDMKDSTSLLGHTALMFEDEKYIVNQRVGLIRPNNNVDINYPWLYILTNSHGFISDLRNRANSGVQINLSTSEIKNTKIIIPDKETNKLFNLLTLPIFEKMKNIYFQIQTLEETRDSLLPKLMSGKTRIQGFKVD